MSSYSTGLSKTLLLKGLQCPRALWLAKHPPAFVFPPRPELEARYAAGTEVGQLAQGLFPGGVEVPYAGLPVAEQVERTRDLIAQGATVIYEASFAYDGIFVKVDILERDGHGPGSSWRIHEVKMGTAVKPVNLDDVAIQLYVLSGCGLEVSAASLVHIDNGYVRHGALDIRRLFTRADVLEEARVRQGVLPSVIAALRQELRSADEPAVDIGPHCHDPYDCDYIPWCWRHLPENSVFDLRGSGIDRWTCYHRGLIRFDQLPLDELNPRQRQQVEATLTQEDSHEPGRLREFLATLWYPLVHLDFETFSTPVPQLDGTRPYQQVPFQYSLHLQQAPGGEAQHREFLAEPGSDPRRPLLERLLADIPAGACILTYNQAFEKGVLRELAALYPELAGPVEAHLANVRDLMVPFRRRDVYRWRMNGSFSIKAVLPAMVPELSYAGLEIADGEAAMQAWHRLCALAPGAERERLRAALLAYCRMDTWAMVKILEELEKLV